jgi:hypothetical protein
LSIAAVAGIHELDPRLWWGLRRLTLTRHGPKPDRGLTMEGLPARAALLVI